ncbi:hypothetical protein SAMN02745823_03202 [Sporobacter termitidis DSM 10068]|uniref:Uncharacterized protein n=1 Tax=Sporobacter termitidis DSM 10068 TaxID=1123282 RepID=A0A1M5Z4D5_9FIRM|nr:hypothetical protein [Sporobacter termitidis]SHI19041.1 hypothetical protein SAMN02745823_03202 [Sporobacter termitidis DSM 10068]
MNDNRLSALDRALQTGGADRLKSGFRSLASTDRKQALRLLDDEKLRFPALFALLPELHAHQMTNELSPRNHAAVCVCAKKLKRYDRFDASAGFRDNDTLYRALRWMLDTGKEWDASGRGQDDYEAVIDYVSALLVIDFEDTAVLPDIARLIFARHRRGHLVHDLTWCFFQTLDKDALALVAGQLLSSDNRDAALAGKLLCLESPPALNKADTQELHHQYVQWLEDNRPYLYVTGEYFQQTSRPKHLSVDMEAKYLGKELSPRYRAPLTPLNEHEIACLHEYRGFSPEEQELLTDYSHRLRCTDAQSWQAWMQKQVAEQVMAAKGGYEAV